MIEFEDIFDDVIADELGVSIDHYIEQIESEKFTHWERKYIILSMLSENEKHKNKALKLWKKNLMIL